MQNLFVFFLIMLTAVISIPEDALAQITAEPELITSPAQSNELMNTLPQEKGPVIVTASFELRDINDINDEAETFEFTGVLKLSWHDPRQAFDPVDEGVKEKLYLGNFQFTEMYTGWFPQVVLVNKSGLYEKHGVLLRVSPDGSITLLEAVDAAAKVDLNLQRYPFDRQRLEAVFEVLGFDSNEVVFKGEPGSINGVLNFDQLFQMPQWYLTEINSLIRTRNYTTIAGNGTATSTFVVSMDLQRRSFFILRLVVLPLMVIVILSWSVFWMDKSSLGDRISVSFIGILTVVAYQMVLGEILPRIAYINLMNLFLNISFLTICASVIVNLRVSHFDRHGKSEEGDRLDLRCRWIFPMSYFGLLLVAALMAFFLLPLL